MIIFRCGCVDHCFIEVWSRTLQHRSCVLVVHWFNDLHIRQLILSVRLVQAVHAAAHWYALVHGRPWHSCIDRFRYQPVTEPTIFFQLGVDRKSEAAFDEVVKNAVLINTLIFSLIDPLIWPICRDSNQTESFDNKPQPGQEHNLTRPTRRCRSKPLVFFSVVRYPRRRKQHFVHRRCSGTQFVVSFRKAMTKGALLDPGEITAYSIPFFSTDMCQILYAEFVGIHGN